MHVRLDEHVLAHGSLFEARQLERPRQALEHPRPLAGEPRRDEDEELVHEPCLEEGRSQGRAAFEQQRYLVAAGMLACLLVVFLGMGTTVLAVVQGTPSKAVGDARRREGLLVTLPPLLLIGASLVMGLALPQSMRALVQDAATFIGAQP